MDIKDTYEHRGCGVTMENFVVQFRNPMCYDRLHTLSVEYSVPVELLVSMAVERLIEDVDFVRDLRAGKIMRK